MRRGIQGFVGARLREAREARALTASTLAELVGVTRGAISQYEGDFQSPSPETMRRLADCLNLPIQFFLVHAPTESRGTVFYRCMSAATKRSRMRAERRYGWLRRIVAILRIYVEFPRVDYPEFDVPTDPIEISFDQVEQWALQTRRHWSLGDGPISNVVWLLENHGTIVSRFPLCAETLDAFSEWHAGESVPYVILGSEKGSAARSRYDAAHELGHLIMHRNLSEVMFRTPPLFKLLESQAHRFANAFLLPPVAFAEDVRYPSLDSFQLLKEKWNVSIAAMIKRARQLNLVDEQQERRLWINLGRRKWKTKEPLDDVLVPEKPSLVRKSLELLITHRLLGIDEVQLRVGLPEADIEELVGLERGYLASPGPNVELRTDRKAESAPRTIPFSTQ